jgi:DNA-binding beta-propeller fold protein YncE
MVDTENHAIRVVGSSVGTFAGTGSPGLVNGPVASAQFNFPTKLAKDSAGNVYVADAGNNVIRKIDTSGNVTTFAGSGVAGHADGTGGSAQFRLPSGIVYNSNDGALYVADAGNNLVRRITAAGTVTTYAGNGTGGLVNGALLQSEFYHPSDIAVLGTNIVVSDTYNNAIRIINTSASTVATLID